MKKLNKLILAVTSIAMLALASCQNLANDSVGVVKTNSKGAKLDVPTGEKTLRVDSEGLFLFPDEDVNGSARTIMPGAVNTALLKFYLVFKDTINDSTDNMEEVIFTKDAGVSTHTQGTITRSFNLSDYSFKLYAVDPTLDPGDGAGGSGLTSSNIATYASFVGYANADFRYYDVVSFHMKVNSKSDGTGAVDLTFNHSKPDGANFWKIPEKYQVTAALYDINTDEKVYPKAGTDPWQLFARQDPQGASPWISGVHVPAAAVKDVPQGEYNLVVRYNYQPASAGTTTKVYEYSEKIVILMNQTTTATVEIPNILETPPEAPIDLKVSYLNPVNIESDTYPVQFVWTDKAKNESEFEFELLIFPDGGAPVLPDANGPWDTIAGAGGSVETYKRLRFQTSDRYYSGSLTKNSQAAVFNLKLENRYAARIRAVNEAGPSAWCYAVMDSSAPNSFLDFDADVTTINLFKITYDLNGGTFYDAAATGAKLVADVPALVHYASQRTDTSGGSPAIKEDVNIILSPDGITTQKWIKDISGKNALGAATALTLMCETDYWSKWLVDSDTGTGYGQTVTYDKAGTLLTGYVKNMKYYPTTVTNDSLAKTTALGAQPDSSNYGTEKDNVNVRKAVSDAYAGYKNLTLVANYDTTKTFLVEIDDITLYELKSSAIKTAFAKGAVPESGKIDYADAVTAPTALSGVTNGVLEVSLGKVDNIKFTIDTATAWASGGAKFKKTSYDPGSNTIVVTDGTYDKVHLKVTSIANGKVVVDQDWNGTKDWTVQFKAWAYGNYKVEFTAVTSEMPNIVYSYTTVLKITQ